MVLHDVRGAFDELLTFHTFHVESNLQSLNLYFGDILKLDQYMVIFSIDVTFETKFKKRGKKSCNCTHSIGPLWIQHLKDVSIKIKKESHYSIDIAPLPNLFL